MRAECTHKGKEKVDKRLKQNFERGQINGRFENKTEIEAQHCTQRPANPAHRMRKR
jgi:hypothetical protein